MKKLNSSKKNQQVLGCGCGLGSCGKSEIL
ncbi:hypothetical protein Y592_03425 [Thermosipho sp. 1070]|nr:hypothetical protein Y592_03425 [Thermosipho sp. 1070]